MRQRSSILSRLSPRRLWFLTREVATYAVLIALLFAMLAPIYWIIASSLKPESVIRSWPPQWIPNPISFRSYERIFALLPIGRFFLNSGIIAVVMIITNVVFCSLAGYTFARKQFPGRDKIFALILGSMMIPGHIRLIPSYLITQKLGMVDTYQGIILPTAVTAFGIFMMRQYFKTLPVEVEDAARVDGCSEWGVLFRIVLPMSRPAVVSLALFALVWSLEDFLWPLVVTSTLQMRPLPVGITMFLGLVVYEWGPVTAITAITIIPIIIIYLFLQRQFVRGLTVGAVKG